LAVETSLAMRTRINSRASAGGRAAPQAKAIPRKRLRILILIRRYRFLLFNRAKYGKGNFK
jgi:hypothetical protein